ncbi:chemotaxis protein CheW [Halopseudomonas pertucinogena]|uniref:Chemotaxis protein n=1 Tax=Halopseudomonas pertucinogena TaxID=86175 RepID=A0ABQ2CRS6_9GAMM|nr:chemotaxis protein CheW [Halopseudomonas pertucinogena]GGJ02525.1 chemotaxis protein [Halopseudomonas pertucinogena]
MSDALDSLNGLIIPLTAEPLLLPNVAVAELVGYRLVETAAQGPDWFLGWANWRDQRIPLADAAQLLGQPPLAPDVAPRMLILNAVGGDERLRFIALRVAGIPRSRRVLRGEIGRVAGGSGFVSQLVSLADEERSLLIPDLAAIEQALAQAAAQ